MDTNTSAVESRQSKDWHARGATVGQMRATFLCAAALRTTPIVEGGITAYVWSETNCGHEDCAASDAMADACARGQTVKHYAIAFMGAKSKPEWHYRFRTAEQARAKVAALVASRASHEKAKADRKVERKTLAVPVKVGDILYSSWGYDQTTVDFYEVAAVRGATGMTVDLVKIGKREATAADGQHYRDAVMPLPGRRIASDREDRLKGKRVQAYEGRAYITLTSYSSARPWDGKPHHETPFGQGH